MVFATHGDALFTFAEPAETMPAFLSKTVRTTAFQTLTCCQENLKVGATEGGVQVPAQVLGSKAVMLACLTLGLQLPFDIHLPVHPLGTLCASQGLPAPFELFHTSA